MFKRRKPDDLAGPAPADLAAELPRASPGSLAPSDQSGPAAAPSADDAVVDTGVGVPPFKPALVQPAFVQPASSALKESPMGRSPFPTATTNLPPAVGPRPAPAPTRPNGPGAPGGAFAAPRRASPAPGRAR